MAHAVGHAVAKELGLSHPGQQHGSSANDHVQEQTAVTPDRGDTDTIYDREKSQSERRREETRTSVDSHGFSRTQLGVDVERAEMEFAELNKELSAVSWRMSRIHSRSSGHKGEDVEAFSTSDETSEEWNLEDTLRGAREADSAAGIKSKYIGKQRPRALASPR